MLAQQHGPIGDGEETNPTVSSPNPTVRPSTSLSSSVRPSTSLQPPPLVLGSSFRLSPPVVALLL